MIFTDLIILWTIIMSPHFWMDIFYPRKYCSIKIKNK